MRNFVLSRCTAIQSSLRAACAAVFLVLVAASAASAQYTVTAEWDQNTDAYTRGYRVYFGLSSGNYLWSVDNGYNTRLSLNVGPSRYYFVVRAYNASAQLGPASSEVTVTVGMGGGPGADIYAYMSSSTRATITWTTTNATSAMMNGYAVPLSGTFTWPIYGPTTFTLVARSASGATATDSVTVDAANAPPMPPTDLEAAVSGSHVTLDWSHNPSGGNPADYVLYVGTSKWGTNRVNGQSIGEVNTISANLPNGIYYARLRARNERGISRSSAPEIFAIGRRLSAPTGLDASWSGSTTTLNWVASAADSVETTPTNYVLEAGSGPGLANLGTIDLGPSTSFTTDVPPGVYYVRIRATNDNGSSSPTPDIIIAPPGTAAAPRELSSGGAGSTVRLSWTPPPGEAPSGYIIEAGSDPGLSDIAVLPVGNVTSFATEAPPGTYFVRVRAVNAHGPGVPSNEVVVQK